MDAVCKIILNDGTSFTMDGYDELYFYNEIPKKEKKYGMYDFSKNKQSYYDAMNDLAIYPFIGIKRYDNSHELKYDEISYAYKHKQADIILEKNEILYLQTNAINTIALFN